MLNYNPENERIKRQYFAYLREAKGYSEPTVDGVAAALARFEADTKWRAFKRFHYNQAIAFKRRLADQQSQKTGEKLSKATMHATLAHVRSFFHWLAGQPGYKSRLQYSDADYFKLSDKDARVANARYERRVPTLEQIRHVVGMMPATTAVERRDRALLAFAILTGARDSAIASFKLRHVDVAEGNVFQDGRDVKTKYSKTFMTWFFEVGDDLRTIFEEWVAYLRTEQLWGENDPLFPATRVERTDSERFEVVGLERAHWSNATPIRSVFRKAFEAAGLPYFNPHSFRKTLALLGEKRCTSPEHFKAWSQNLGHEQVLTTFNAYGQVATSRQAEIIRSFRSSENPDHVSPSILRIARQIESALRAEEAAKRPG